jgi:hypothetical protein
MSTGRKRLLAYIIMLASVLMSVKLIKDIIRLWHVDDRLIEAEAELMTARGKQEELEKQLDEAGRNEWWENQVRNTLKMARENEEIVVVPEEIGQSREQFAYTDETGELGKEMSNVEKWWRVFVY